MSVPHVIHIAIQNGFTTVRTPRSMSFWFYGMKQFHGRKRLRKYAFDVDTMENRHAVQILLQSTIKKTFLDSPAPPCQEAPKNAIKSLLGIRPVSKKVPPLVFFPEKIPLGFFVLVFLYSQCQDTPQNMMDMF